MSKPHPVDVLYGQFEVTFNVPSTVEEGDNAVGEVGAVLEGFIDDTLYRNTLPRLYADVSKQLVAKGHAKAVVGESKSKDGKTTKPVYESDIVHIDRIHKDSDDATKSWIGDALREAATRIAFYEKGERTGGGKVSQGALDSANKFFAEGDGKVEAIVEHIESNVPGYKVARDVNGSATPESLARGIQAFGKYVEAQAKKTAQAGLAAVAA